MGIHDLYAQKMADCKQNVQDEMIALHLQLSMVETERDKIKRENKELVERLMKWKATEADAMNLMNVPVTKRG